MLLCFQEFVPGNKMSVSDYMKKNIGSGIKSVTVTYQADQ
jgi:hypothetical protein